MFRPAQDNLFIYTWNPSWQTFQCLSLKQKIQAFKIFIQKCQLHFWAQNLSFDIHPICLIIAPDLIFSAPAPTKEGEQDFLYLYTQADKKYFDDELIKICPNLDPNTLVVAGSIAYALPNELLYYTSTTVLSLTFAKRYDKKQNDGTLGFSNGKYYQLKLGKESGLFYFNCRKIGIEICQDHETATLKKELGNQTVDIHILLSEGQSIRDNHIASGNKNKPGIFIQCERKPGEEVQCEHVKKVLARSDTYIVNHANLEKNHPSQYIDIHRKKLYQYITDNNNQAAKNLTIHLDVLNKRLIDRATNISVCNTILPNLSLKNKLLNEIRLPTLHPAWQFITKIGIKPKGVNEIGYMLYNNHQPWELQANNAKVTTLLQMLGERKSKNGSFTRHPITELFYEILAEPTVQLEDIRNIKLKLDKKWEENLQKNHALQALNNPLQRP